MFYKYCGSKIEGEDSFCKNCGAKLIETPQVNQTIEQPTQKQENPAQTLSILGLIFSFVCAIAGLILSVIALKKYKTQTNQDGKGMATAGLVISIVSVAGSILSFFTVFISFLSAL